VASVVSEAFVVPTRSARTERPSQPTGLRDDSGFASMVEDASAEPRPAERSHSQPRDRVNPAERTKASETQPTDKPLVASEGDSAVPVENETTATEDQSESTTETILAPDGSAVVAPAEGTETIDTTLDVTLPEVATPDAPVIPQVVATSLPATPEALIAPVIAAATADAAQAPDALPADNTAKSAQPVTAGAAASAAPAATGTPAAPDNAVPEQAQTDSAQPAGTNAAASAQPASPQQTGTDTTEASGQSKAQPAATGTPLLTGVDAETEATIAADHGKAANDKPEKVTQTPVQTTARPDADKPAAQADATVTPDDAALPTKSSVDPSMQTAQITTPAHAAMSNAAAAGASQAAPVSAAQPIPVNAVAVEIAAQARAGNSRFEIRLDPPELGRIDVRLDIDSDGNVKSRLIIERTDTYDLLRRDQSTLERALQQAGLKTSDNALEFSLRDQGFAQHRDADDRPRGTSAMIAEADVAPSEAASGYARMLGARGGLDIRV
jgi:flagellar hook-length control protein FliK